MNLCGWSAAHSAWTPQGDAVRELARARETNAAPPGDVRYLIYKLAAKTWVTIDVSLPPPPSFRHCFPVPPLLPILLPTRRRTWLGTPHAQGMPFCSTVSASYSWNLFLSLPVQIKSFLGGGGGHLQHSGQRHRKAAGAAGTGKRPRPYTGPPDSRAGSIRPRPLAGHGHPHPAGTFSCLVLVVGSQLLEACGLATPEANGGLEWSVRGCGLHGSFGYFNCPRAFLSWLLLATGHLGAVKFLPLA